MSAWLKTIYVIATNALSIWSAFQSRPIFGQEGYWQSMRGWLTQNIALFHKIAQSTPIGWDDKTVAALQSVLNLPQLWGEVETEMSRSSVGTVTELQTLRDRVRARIQARRSAQAEAVVEEETESISTAIVILTLISSSAGVFDLLKRLRKFAAERRSR